MNTQTDIIMRLGELEINFSNRMAMFKSKIAKITYRELQILKCLKDNRHALSCKQLADCVYKDEVNGGPLSAATLRVQIYKLRKKLFDLTGGKFYIDSHGWGGYSLKNDVKWDYGRANYEE